MNTEQAWAIAADLAKTGKPWAKKASDLIEACIENIESTDGISLAFGMVLNSEEIAGQMVDDFISKLMPAIISALDSNRRALDFYFPEAEQGSGEAGDLATKEPPATAGDGEVGDDDDTDADEEELDIDHFR